jgi:hypothetical protein
MSTVQLVLAPNTLHADLTAETSARIAGDAVVTSAFQAADALIIASGASPANVGIAPVIATGSTAARTVADRFGEVVNVKDFGAIGELVSGAAVDDWAAIQAAIDYAHGSDPNVRASQRVVYLPRARNYGGYFISQPLKVYSGTKLVGDGTGTVINPIVTNMSAMIEGALWPGDVDGYLSEVYIEGLTLGAASTPSVMPGGWGINLNGRVGECMNIVNCEVKDISFRTANGLNASTYAQMCQFTDLKWFGNGIDRMIWVRGNVNMFNRIDKEGAASGISTDPLILIESHTSDPPFSSSNSAIFRDLILEGSFYSGQGIVKCISNSAGFNGNIVFDNVWIEAGGGSAAFIFWFEKVANYYIKGLQGPLTRTWGQLHSVQSDGRIDMLDLGTDFDRIQQWVVLDADSTIVIDDLYTRCGYAPLVDRRYDVRREHTYWGSWPNSFPADAVTGRRISQQSDQNLLVNGSFESGVAGWIVRGSHEFDNSARPEDSTVALGKMIKISFGLDADIKQSVVIRAQDVGLPFTFSALVKIDSTNIAVSVNPYVEGTTFDGSNRDGTLIADGAWHVVSCTFIPAAAGTIQVGIVSVNTAGISVYVDECRLSRGAEARPAGFRTEQIELGSASITRGASAPTAGTWKIGDIVLNSAPTSGSPMGWMCVTAGDMGDPNWAPNTAYALRARCTNAGNTYQNGTNGVSAVLPATGPAGTGAGIVDGGCTWYYIGPAGVFKALGSLAA